MSSPEKLMNTQEQQLKYELCQSIRNAILTFESQTPYRVLEINVDLTRNGDVNGINREPKVQPKKFSDELLSDFAKEEMPGWKNK
jgi:hypothetical protein